MIHTVLIAAGNALCVAFALGYGAMVLYLVVFAAIQIIRGRS